MEYIDTIMQNPYGALALFALAAMMIGNAITIALLYKLFSKFEGINRSNVALSQSLNSHEVAVKELPAAVSNRVAESVSAGLQPLAEKLSNDHEQFIRAFGTLNMEGDLTEWVHHFREVTEPFQKASIALEDHYATNRNILATMQDLVPRLGKVQDVTQSSLERITLVAENWKVSESDHIRNMENRITVMVQEVMGIHQEVAHGLSEQQVATAALTRSNKELENSVVEIASIVKGFEQLSIEIDERYHKLSNHIRITAESISSNAIGIKSIADRRLKRIGQVVEKWEADEESHTREIERRIMDRLKEVRDTHVEITDFCKKLLSSNNSLQGSVSTMAGAVKTLSNHIDKLRKTVRDINDKHKSLLEMQESFQQKMLADQKGFQEQFQQILTSFKDNIDLLSTRSEELFRKTDFMLESLRETTLHMNETYQAVQEGFAREHEERMKNHQDIYNRQKRLLDESSQLSNRFFRHVPSRRLQLAMVAILCFHLLVTGAIAYVAFQSIL